MSISASMLTMQRQSKNTFYGNKSRRDAVDTIPSNRSRIRHMAPSNNDVSPMTNIGKVLVVNEACPLWAKFGQNNRRQSVYTGPLTAPITRWSYPIGASISTASINLNGIVYVGSDSGVLYALDSLGRLQWSYSTASPIRSSPVLDSAGNVLIASAGTVYSIYNGRVVWKFSTQSSDTGSGIQSSLTLTKEGYAIFGSLDTYIYCLKDGVPLWSVKTGGEIQASATLIDRTVYIGSSDSNLYAIDIITGKILWTYTTGGAIISTPAIGNGYIYFGSSDRCVYALTTAGLLQWKYTCDAPIYSSPSVGAAIYITSEDNYIYALDPLIGILKWRILLGISPTSPVLGRDGTVYVTSQNITYAVSTNGHIIWKYLNGSGASPTISQDGTIYLASGSNMYSIQGYNLPRVTNTGWYTFGNNNQRQSTNAGSITKGLFIKRRLFIEPIFSSPSILDGTIYIGGGNKLYAIDSQTFAVRWTYTTNGIVNSSPTFLQDGTVFFGSTDGYIYAVLSNGNLLWKFQTETDGIRDAQIQGTNSTITLTNGYAIFGAFDYYIYCLDSTLGTLVWKVKTGGQVQGSAAISGITAYIGSADYSLYAINILSGEILWTYKTDFIIDSIPAIGYNGLIYFGSIDNTLYALNSSGILQWKYTTSGSIYSSAAINIFGTLYFLSSDGYLYSIKGDVGTLIWKTFIGRGFSISSPIIGADRNIYVGSGSGKLYVVNEITGDIVLSYSLNSSIESTPLIGNDGTIYVGTVAGYLYSLTDVIDPPIWPMFGLNSIHSTSEQGPSTLNLVWKVQLNTPGTLVSSPCIDKNGIVYIGSDYGISALDSLTGYTIWTYSSGPVYSSPTIDANGMVYFISEDGYIYSVSSGILAWKYYTGGNGMSRSSVTLYDRYIIFGSNTYVYCLYKDGTFVWKLKTRDVIQGSATIDKGTVYIGSMDTFLYSIDLVKGKLNYIFSGGAAIYSTPAVESCANIYITSLDSKVYALNKGCNRIWSYKTEGPIYSSVAIGTNRVIYVTSTDGYLYALRGETGTLIWKVFLSIGLKSTPMIDSIGNIYVGFFIVNSSGSILSQFSSENFIESCACIYNGTAYVSSTDGYIYSMNSSSNTNP